MNAPVLDICLASDGWRLVLVDGTGRSGYWREVARFRSLHAARAAYHAVLGERSDLKIERAA